jgi:hypothetical protein
MLVRGGFGYFSYLRDLGRYGRLNGAEKTALVDLYPCIHDKTGTHAFDRHYFYQDTWAARKIYESKCRCHVDVGSRIDFVAFLSVMTKVTFLDIRLLPVTLDNFNSIEGSVLALPYEDGSVESLSCLHVAEHIGLGRYGDPLDPLGTQKAAKELSRVLAYGGNLYFSVPIGEPRVCFNAHRIHSVRQILDYFSELRLIELSGINDDRHFCRNVESQVLDSCTYGCGLFHFSKR